MKAAAVLPAMVSQHTCSGWGFKSGSAFLRFVAKHRVPHVRDGKTVFVKMLDLEAAFEQLKPNDQADVEYPDTAEAVLAQCGFLLERKP